MNWVLLRDSIILSVCMLAATGIRARLACIQRYYVPSALMGGVIALLLYEFFQLPREMLGAMVYHLLNISFISMSLRSIHAPASLRNIARNSFAIFFQYALQILLGLAVTLFFIYTFIPDLSLGFGTLLPLGFALGAGTAYSITSTWQGFPDAAALSLFIASLGYVIACFVGIVLIHHARKRGLVEEQQKVMIPDSQPSDLVAKPAVADTGKSSWNNNGTIDRLSLHISIVLLVYGLTWGLLRIIEVSMLPLGDSGASIARSLWGIAFLFASLLARLVRFCLGKRRANLLLDTYTLNRINGTAIDYMLCAAIAAITFQVVAQYWLPLLVMSCLGLVFALVSVWWFCSRMYHDHVFTRTLMIFGVSTGTLSCALGLLRIVDPDFMLPVANDYMHSMKLNFFLGMPLILVINLPYQSSMTGNSLYLYITIGLALLYAVGCLLALYILGNRRSPRRSQSQ